MLRLLQTFSVLRVLYSPGPPLINPPQGTNLVRTKDGLYVALKNGALLAVPK